jgi:hypothetical protein
MPWSKVLKSSFTALFQVKDCLYENAAATACIALYLCF